LLAIVVPNSSDFRIANLTSSRVLARNVVWNLVGTVSPLALGFFAVRLLVRGMGADRFGILTLAWATIGYFGFFDLGLGRALTLFVAEKLGKGDQTNISVLAWTSLQAMLLLGCIGGALMAALSPTLVHSVLRIPKAIQPETLRAFFVLSAALPIVITSAGLRGILEAYQRFAAVSILRVILGTLTFGGPLLVLPFSHSVYPMAAALALGRLLVWAVNLVVCLVVIPELRQIPRFDVSLLKLLIGSGLWMTISNILGPLLAYMDRFLIGAMMSVAAVAYYATPYEFVTKYLLIPGAMTGVLFPAFSSSFFHSRTQLARLFERGAKFTFVVLFPLVLVTAVFARDGLRVWLGPAFAENGAHVLQWLSAGVLINGLALVPFAQIQGIGRPDLTAKLHMIEFPVYLFVLWQLIARFGIAGAAIAWTVRVAIDCVLLFLIAQRLLPDGKAAIRRTGFTAAAGLAVLLLGVMIGPLSAKVVFSVVTLGAFGAISWFIVLTPEERVFMWNKGRAPLVAD
jgi:O-antigen/teichoic acid export membrane protein